MRYMTACIQDILLILSQIDRGYKALFKHLRLQLLKKRKEIHATMKKADIPIPIEDEVPAVEELDFN